MYVLAMSRLANSLFKFTLESLNVYNISISFSKQDDGGLSIVYPWYEGSSGIGGEQNGAQEARITTPNKSSCCSISVRFVSVQVLVNLFATTSLTKCDNVCLQLALLTRGGQEIE